MLVGSIAVAHWAVVAGSMVVEAVVEGMASVVAAIVGTVETLDIFPLSRVRLDKIYF